MPIIKYFAGIGSRSTPIELKSVIYEISCKLIEHDWVLRSGGANGADEFFESAYTTLNGNKEIYIPWKGFNKSKSTLFYTPPEAFKVAKHFHSRWNYLSQAAQKLMARNVLQVLGQSLVHPVEFVICWTEDGCECQKTRNIKTGGTGQAISIAEYWDVPVINMANWNWKDRLNDITGINLYES
jgi:hypothetical protein